MDRDRLTLLERQLRAEALNHRIAALNELAQVPSDEAVPLLQRLLQDTNFALRKLAVMGLGNHQVEASLRSLEAVLTEETDANVLSEAANSVFEFGPTAFPILVQLFERSEHWLVKQTVISLFAEAQYGEWLMAIAPQALAWERPEHPPDSQLVKETAILALGNLLIGPLKEQALELLLPLATSSQWRTRWRTIMALRRTHDPRAQAMRAKLQQDENHYVVAAALEPVSEAEG